MRFLGLWVFLGGFRVSRFLALGSGDSGFRVPGCRVWELGSRFLGSGFRGVGFRFMESKTPDQTFAPKSLPPPKDPSSILSQTGGKPTREAWAVETD